MFPIKRTPYTQGYLAYCNAEHLENNPYLESIDPASHRQWVMGWEDGQKDHAFDSGE